MSDPSSPARRKPVQIRSQDTVEQIYRATAALLESAAPSDITTVHIARQAGLSVGAVYRFFPDKQAIYDAIAVRYMEQFRSAVSTALETGAPSDGPGFLTTVIDAYIAFLDAHPAFRALALSRQISPATREDQAGPEAGAPSLVRSFMIGELGVLASPELNRKLRVASEAGEHLIGYAYRQPDSGGRRAVIDELKALLSGYLFPNES